MSDNAPSTPRLRFRGFTDAWEQRKIENCFTERNERSSIGELISVTMNSGVMKASDLGRHNTSSDDKSNYKRVEVGDIAYNSMRMWQGASGYSQYSGILSPAYTVITPNDATYSPFFSYLFKRPDMIHTFQIRSQGLTSDTWNLKWPALSAITATVPTFEEQEKISGFFATLDRLITLHQRELDLQKKLKQSLLQKMFPKNGESKPEIRFAGFTDAWEQRKLNNYLKTSNQKNKEEKYSKKDVLSVSGDFGIVNQIEFQGRSFAGVSVATYGIVETNDIVYTKSPLKANPYGIIKTNSGKPGIVSTLYAIYTVKGNVAAKFVEYYFEDDLRLNMYLKPLVNKGAKNDMKVSDDNALKGEVIFPTCLDEQIRIAAIFQELDRLITLHQRELEQLKSIKQSLLKLMFV